VQQTDFGQQARLIESSHQLARDTLLTACSEFAADVPVGVSRLAAIRQVLPKRPRQGSNGSCVRPDDKGCEESL